MRAVFEDVCPWHGARTESVHEHCFELALDEVEDYDCHGEFLKISWRGNIGCAEGWVGVDVGSEGVDCWVYEDWAKVFDDEDGAPCNLWSEVFHGNSCAGGKASLLECGRLFIGDEASIFFCYAQSVNGVSCCSCDFLV
jgi:hypothetical protein